MIDKLPEFFYSVLISLKILRIDFYVETVPSEEIVGSDAAECCGPMAIRMVAEPRWFWEKKNPTTMGSL